MNSKRDECRLYNPSSVAFRVMVGKQLHLIICWMFHQLEYPMPRLSKAASLLSCRPRLEVVFFWDLSWLPVSLATGSGSTPFHSISAQASIPDTTPNSDPDNQLRHFRSFPVVVFSCLQCLGRSLAHGRCSPNTCQLNNWRNVPLDWKFQWKEELGLFCSMTWWNLQCLARSLCSVNIC